MSKRYKWFEQPLRWGNILLVGATLLTYVIPNINPNFSGWFSILGLFYPVLILLNIAFLVFWIYRKQYRLVIVTTLCILLGWNYLNANFGVNYFSPIKGVHEDDLSIVTYNIRAFRTEGKFDKEKRIDKIEETLNIVKYQQPDIFCGQEFSYPNRWPWYNNAITDQLGATKHIATNKLGLVIFSKFPIINSESVSVSENGEKSRNCFFADVQINNNLIIRVYNVHLESNRVTDRTESIELDTETLQEKSTWKTIYHVFGSIKNNQKLRASQIEYIVKHIEGSPYPVVLCGDFNDTPLSYTYKSVHNVLQDNFAVKGRGLGTSYNGNIPFLKIDYIFSDQRFKVIRTKIMRNYTSSDHFPVSTTISW